MLETFFLKIQTLYVRECNAICWSGYCVLIIEIRNLIGSYRTVAFEVDSMKAPSTKEYKLSLRFQRRGAILIQKNKKNVW